jgi:Protein of unknown function (DUF642)
MKGSLKSVLAACAFASVSPAAASLVNNGGFEQGACLAGNTLGPNGCDTPELPGWTVGGPVNWYQTGFNNLKQIALSAHNGSSAVDLVNADGSVRFVSQTFDTLPFQTYEVSFWIGNYSANGGDASIDASITDGTSNTFVFAETAPRPTEGSNWERVSFRFIGDGLSNTLSFSETPDLKYDLSYLGLDDVGVAAVPESPTWAMALAGFAGLALVGYRGARRAVSVAA